MFGDSTYTTAFINEAKKAFPNLIFVIGFNLLIVRINDRPCSVGDECG